MSDSLLRTMSRDEFRAWLTAEAERLAPKQEAKLRGHNYDEAIIDELKPILRADGRTAGDALREAGIPAPDSVIDFAHRDWSARVREGVAALQSKREASEARRIGWMPYGDEGEG